MPFYDYFCQDCQARFDVFMTYSEYGQRAVSCPKCKGTHVHRRMPHVRVAKSDSARADSLAEDFSDPSALAGLENDPQAMGRVMRKMGKEMGEELPSEFNEVVDRLEKGQSPEDIEKDLPDLGNAMDEGLGEA